MNNLELAEKQIKELHDQGYNFEYQFDYEVVGKWMVPIDRLKEIVDKLKEGEKLIFLPNIKAEDSIYWSHFEPNNTIRCIRIDSDMGSLRKWFEDKYLRLVNENEG